MNDNYLLHNETAKKLYFEYAEHLPIISLCSKLEISEKPYNNIAEAFLLNDPYKLLLMRAYGIDEAFINGDASDFEKFKKFCSVLPDLIGNPVYLISHTELFKFYGCDMDINENNCEAIWTQANEMILAEQLSEKKLLAKANVERVPVLELNEVRVLRGNKDITDLASLENAMLDKIREADSMGCRAAICIPPYKFTKPDQYHANEIVKGIRAGKGCSFEQYELLHMQVLRTLCIEYKRLGWSAVILNDDLWKETKEYLNKSNALPKTVKVLRLLLGNDERALEGAICSLARSNALGRQIFILNSLDTAMPYASHIYFRRVLCNYIGELVERGEYTGDEDTIKDLINKILCRNIKELL